MRFRNQVSLAALLLPSLIEMPPFTSGELAYATNWVLLTAGNPPCKRTLFDVFTKNLLLRKIFFREFYNKVAKTLNGRTKFVLAFFDIIYLENIYKPVKTL